MNDKTIDVINLTKEYKNDLKKISKLNDSIRDYLKKIRNENISSDSKGEFINLCNEFDSSISNNVDRAEEHLNNAIIEIEKCDRVLNSLSDSKKYSSPLYSTGIGLGTGLSIANGLRKIKKENEDNEEDNNNEMVNKHGRNKV